MAIKVDKIKVLFICLGNICRSPMAECIFSNMVKSRGEEDKFEIASRGTSNEEEGNPIYPPARNALIRHNIPVLKHKAQKISQNDLMHYDVIFYMEEYNKRSLERAFPGDPNLHKLRPIYKKDIDDPWYTGDFETTYNEIVDGLEAYLKEIDVDCQSETP